MKKKRKKKKRQTRNIRYYLKDSELEAEREEKKEKRKRKKETAFAVAVVEQRMAEHYRAWHSATQLSGAALSRMEEGWLVCLVVLSFFFSLFFSLPFPFLSFLSHHLSLVSVWISVLFKA